ncbi:MAG TPA: M15 family metallopeptidase, partial [Rummeliibacillus sp.]|nr:M15 family metallopeptidase [Rummeliibacillus sp.]
DMKNTLINKAANKKIDVTITEGIRSFAKQDELYKQGRTTRGKIVTNTKAGESFHNYGLAFDYALLDKNGEIIWDTNYDGNGNGKSDWFEVADIGKKLGFNWGGDWIGFKDYPHLEMTFGLSIDMLKSGYRLNDEEIRKNMKQYLSINSVLIRIK